VTQTLSWLAFVSSESWLLCKGIKVQFLL